MKGSRQQTALLMMTLSGSRLECIILADVCRNTSPLQSCKIPFWIWRLIRKFSVQHVEECVRTSISSSSTVDCLDDGEPGMDMANDEITGSVANMSSERVSSNGSTISGESVR
jgi:hypothetical protein